MIIRKFLKSYGKQNRVHLPESNRNRRMLTRLHIQNYALIDRLEISFREGLNIITGETGAGKSIVLGALSLILGERAEMQAVLDKSRKCIVEGEFNIDERNTRSFFSERSLDFQKQTIIRRELTPDGKSRAFINDTPVNLSTLKELTAMLVDIHSQHETLQIIKPAFQIELVDVFAENEKLLTEYRATFIDWKNKSAQLIELTEAEKKSAADLDYFTFQLGELENASLKEGEESEIESTLQAAQHSEEIKSALNASLQNIDAEQNGILARLRSMEYQLSTVSKFQESLRPLVKRIASVQIELKDISNELEQAESDDNYEPEKIQLLRERLDVLNQLQHKHRVSSTNELLQIENSFREKIRSIESAGERIEELKKEVEKLNSQLKTLAEKLSASRKKIIPSVEKRILRLLSDLKMPDAVFKMERTETELNENGVDEITFLFSANKGITQQPLAKVASGGELSRLMLAVKSCAAKQMKLPLMIFDEIDSGVSGDVALRVGNAMKELAQNHQVIAITHLPQIACRADAHFIVSKEKVSGKAVTSLSELSEEDHILEIAKMIAGGKPSEAAIQNAKELISTTN
jgi:DNA repair protein RecN (Recombination protein N)